MNTSEAKKRLKILYSLGEILSLESYKNLVRLCKAQVVGFVGTYGMGKSLSLTALLWFDMVFTGKDNIVSNMPIKFKEFDINIISLIETAQFDFDKLPKRSCVAWDEIFNDIQARSPMNEKNKYIGQMGVSFRKDEIFMRCTMQFMNTLDGIAANLIEVGIYPSFKINDKRERELKNDYTIRWDCYDNILHELYRIEFNAFPFLKKYNTKYKPNPLIINHDAYLEKLQMKSKKKYEEYIAEIPKKLDQTRASWEQGLHAIE